MVLSFLLLAGCSGLSSSYDPANIRPVFDVRNSPIPVPWPNSKPSQAKAQATARSAVKSGITIRKGHTLYALSRKYGVSIRDLVTANNLRAPYILSVGQRLHLPASKSHIVAKGETGYSISRRYGLTVGELMKLNDIHAPYRLAVGQKLRLPDRNFDRQVAFNKSGITSASSRRKTATRQPSRTPQRKPAAVPPPRSNDQGFVWPIEGRLASRYGPKEGGLHNDGINIFASLGTPVRASETGVVVYASNALEGYGNLLLIKHSGGWITAYAHNERLLVREGQTVKRGDIIARVGSSGGVSKPQLHFEIRKGRRALDPLQYLDRKTAAT